MLEDRREKCHVIIHGAAVTTGGIGAGLAQIPLADSIPITAAQVAMIVAIAKVYDIDLAEGAAKGLLGGFSASVILKLKKELVLIMELMQEKLKLKKSSEMF